jgi:hypothetical protein
MMRALANLTAAAAVLLMLAGCTGGPNAAPSSESEVPAASADATDGEFESRPVQSTNKHLLAEEGAYKFYSLVPVEPEAEAGRLCVVIQSEGGAEGTGCSDSIPYVGTGVEITNLVEAKLVFPGYNASKDLLDGWRYLSNNLLVRGLDGLKSSS